MKYFNTEKTFKATLNTAKQKKKKNQTSLLLKTVCESKQKVELNEDGTKIIKYFYYFKQTEISFILKEFENFFSCLSLPSTFRESNSHLCGFVS